MEGTDSRGEQPQIAKKPLNKITKFSSDSSSDDEEDEGDDDAEDQEGNAGQSNDGDGDGILTKENKNGNATAAGADVSDEPRFESKDSEAVDKQTQEHNEGSKTQEADAVEPPLKKQHIEVKSVDKLIEEELAELGDKSKVNRIKSVGFNFVSLYYIFLVSRLCECL